MSLFISFIWLSYPLRSFLVRSLSTSQFLSPGSPVILGPCKQQGSVLTVSPQWWELLFVAVDWKYQILFFLNATFVQKRIPHSCMWELTRCIWIWIRPPRPELQTFSWISHPYLTRLWIWNILYARWAQHTTHQRVIIGSLWSTWRLRAQRKQLSLHLTLDCLSQQTPFPSPLPALSSEFPPHHNRPTDSGAQNEGTGNGDAVCDRTKMPALKIVTSCGWWPVKILPPGFRRWLVFFSASQTEKELLSV